MYYYINVCNKFIIGSGSIESRCWGYGPPQVNAMEIGKEHNRDTKKIAWMANTSQSTKRSYFHNEKDKKYNKVIQPLSLSNLWINVLEPIASWYHTKFITSALP